MIFWSVLTAVSLLAAGWVVRPLLQRSRVEMDACDGAVSLYRDQAEEVARDAATGLISDAQHDEARRELDRRAARAARRHDTGLLLGRRSPAAAVAVVVVVCGAVLGLYRELGSPALEDRPLAPRQAALAQRLARPDVAPAPSAPATPPAIAPTAGAELDFAGLWARARALTAQGDHAAAAEAYRGAAARSGDAPAVLSAYAEALTLANGNRVPPAARIVFRQVLEKASDEPRARYYLALAQAQAQDFEGALAGWLALLEGSDSGAPWIPTVRRDIVNMVRFLRGDLTSVLPDASAGSMIRTRRSATFHPGRRVPLPSPGPQPFQDRCRRMHLGQ